MAFPKKNAAPLPEVAAMAPKKKGKGKMPAAGASKPMWSKIADQMTPGKC